MSYVNKVSKDVVLTLLLFITLATVVFTNSIALNNNQDIKKISESNNQFWTNFSDYMRCLVVPDLVVYETLGKELYFNECDKLLFYNTGLVPNITKVTVPTTVTTVN